MPQPICSRCKKRPAMVYVRRTTDQNTTQTPYCLPCALEVDPCPIKSMLRDMGVSADEANLADEQFHDLLREGGDEMFQQIMHTALQMLEQEKPKEEAGAIKRFCCRLFSKSRKQPKE